MKGCLGGGGGGKENGKSCKRDKIEVNNRYRVADHPYLHKIRLLDLAPDFIFSCGYQSGSRQTKLPQISVKLP